MSGGIKAEGVSPSRVAEEHCICPSVCDVVVEMYHHFTKCSGTLCIACHVTSLSVAVSCVRDWLDIHLR